MAWKSFKGYPTETAESVTVKLKEGTDNLTKYLTGELLH